MFVNYRKFAPTLATMMLLSQLVYAEPVNINTADATALAKALNGIGPAKAKAIVSYRDKNGRSSRRSARHGRRHHASSSTKIGPISSSGGKGRCPAPLPRPLHSPRRNRRRNGTRGRERCDFPQTLASRGLPMSKPRLAAWYGFGPRIGPEPLCLL